MGAPNNTNFTTDKILQAFWGGARYAVRSDIDLTVAYYHESQNSFVIGNGGNPTGTCSTAASGGCSGSLDAASFVADYRFARHFDAYAGVMYSQVQNGLANSFLLIGTGNKVSSYDPTVGLRYQFELSNQDLKQAKGQSHLRVAEAARYRKCLCPKTRTD